MKTDEELVENIRNKIKKLGEQRRYDKALIECDKALSILPKDPMMHRIKGWAFIYLQKYDQAIKCIDNAIKYSDADYRRDCIVDKIRFLNYGERYEESIKLANDALRSGIRSKDVYGSKGTALHQIYNDSMIIEDAYEIIDCYDKALRYEPDSFLLDSKGRLFADLGRYDEAVKCFDQALSLKPEDADVIMGGKANSLYKAGRRDEAVKCCKQLIKMNSKDSETQYVLAETLCHLGFLHKALDAANTSIKLDPTSLLGHEARDNILYKLGQLPEDQ